MAGGAGDDLYLFVDLRDLIIEGPALGGDTVITMCDLLMSPNIEVLIVAPNISNLLLSGNFEDDVMIGNGLSHRFEGGGGDDLILADGQTLDDITGLFANWFSPFVGF